MDRAPDQSVDQHPDQHPDQPPDQSVDQPVDQAVNRPALSAVDDHPGVLQAGGDPHTQWLPESIQLEGGYIVTGRDVRRTGDSPSRWTLDRAPLPLETSVPGVFAAGDALHYRSIKRVASAVGDGATAVRLVHEYLAEDFADDPAGAPAA